ncbi:ABC transporter substrate-binding protein [Bradyrhizobium sp. DASA03007]|uniref:ABC transporter substrate-binding protein n=1 Tax=unclassified Bradyrhizobium TaxID=2631580 RepID=UPI003F71D181
MRRRDVITGIAGAATSSILPLMSARAQQSTKRYRIGYLALLPGEDKSYAKLLLQRLQELGYREGLNLVWDYRSAEGHTHALAPLAVELVSAGPDVLVGGFGTLAPKAAMAATRIIPIVFTSVGDPVGAGLVKSLREPGGNVTGMSVLAADIAAKKLEMINELVPGKKPTAVLGNPDTPFTALALNQVNTAAAVSEIPLLLFEARTVEEALTAIDAASNAGAASMLVLEDPVLLGGLRQIIDRLAQARLPAVFGPKECASAGALIAFGPDQRHLYRKAADYVDKILKGASPANLPVEQPTQFELIINLKAAKKMGLAVPPALFASASEVIE